LFIGNKIINRIGQWMNRLCVIIKKKKVFQFHCLTQKG
jgi:hypothetical protein